MITELQEILFRWKSDFEKSFNGTDNINFDYIAYKTYYLLGINCYIIHSHMEIHIYRHTVQLHDYIHYRKCLSHKEMIEPTVYIKCNNIEYNYER